MIWSGLDPALVWGLIPRFVGLLYVVAFTALAPQLVGILGVNGAGPIAARLAAARRDFPGARRFFSFPTIFWLNASDRMIRLVPILGVLSGLLACYGGPLGYVGLVLGWLLWNSVEPAGLIFPWDTLLQEVGFYVLFLPITEPLPSLEASALPLPSVAFMHRWLVLRLMLGFAKVKFIGTGKGDSLYLRGFLIWAPLPTPISWWAHHGPRWVLKASLYFMFYAEAIAPVLGFFTGPLRVVSFASLAALMLGIQITGNWGYFNIGYALLCVCLLDTESSVFDTFREPWAASAFQGGNLAINLVMGLMFLTSLVYFLGMNSWVTRTWVHWPWEGMTWNRPWLRALVAYFRALAPFHLTNGYGVFPPNSLAPTRMAPVFEGSDDGGKTWKAYGFRFLPTTPKGRLPLVAPHHPRFDQALHYAGQGIHDASFFGGLIGDGSPYLTFLKTCWLERAAQRILIDDPQVRAELGHNPFPDDPPKLVRVSMYMLAPTRPSERKQTGELWRVRRLGTLVPARGIQPWLEQQSIPEPELFHYDFVDHKKHAAPLREMLRQLDAGIDPDRAVLAASDLTESDVSRFWSEFVPALNVGRGDWTELHARAEAIREKFGPIQLYGFERLLHRFAWMLRARTGVHFVRKVAPRIELNSNFRYEMFLHEVVSDGRDAFVTMLAHPELAAERAKRTTDETQLWALAMVRYDMMMFHIRTFRWHDVGMHGYRFKIHGIFEYAPLLISVQPPEEDFRPTPVKHDDGEFTVEGIYMPAAHDAG